MSYLIGAAVVGGTIISGVITNRQTIASAEGTAQAGVEAALINAGVSAENAKLQAETALAVSEGQVAGAIETALINAGVSRDNAKLQSTTLLQAAEMKALGGEAGVQEAQAQFANIQQLLAPYISAGETALTAQQALAGLGGEDAQREAIARIEQSPEFEAMTRQGEEAILQSASATGGLRGGDVQASLAQFRPAVLSQLIENQYAKLKGLTTVGQAAATTQAGAGVSTGATVASTLAQTGVPGVSQLPAPVGGAPVPTPQIGAPIL